MKVSSVSIFDNLFFHNYSVTHDYFKKLRDILSEDFFTILRKTETKFDS